MRFLTKCFLGVLGAGGIVSVAAYPTLKQSVIDFENSRAVQAEQVDKTLGVVDHAIVSSKKCSDFPDVTVTVRSLQSCFNVLQDELSCSEIRCKKGNETIATFANKIGVGGRIYTVEL